MIGGLLPERGGAVLDIGCGDGRYAKLFDAHRYVGIDIGAYDFGAVSALNRLFCRASADFPPFRAGSFDLVFSSFMIEHTENIHTTLSHIRAMLRPGGSLFLSTGTKCASLTGEMHRIFWPEDGESFGQAHHYFANGELENLLGADFTGIKTVRAGGPLALGIEITRTFFRHLTMKLRGRRYRHSRNSDETGRARKESGHLARFVWRLAVPPLFLLVLLLYEVSYWIDRALLPLRCSKFIVITARSTTETGSDRTNLET
jgi:SAM-dependent methyltransferase